MDQTLHDRLNAHLQLEFEAAHRYLSMALWLERIDLPGFGAWLRGQSADELAHAHRIIDHLADRDLLVKIPAIPAQPTEWASPEAAVAAILESEQHVTHAIEELYDLAESLHDRAASIMLQWFINEQVEEENVARTLLGRLRLIKGDGVGMLMIDQELATGTVPGAMAAAGASGAE